MNNEIILGDKPKGSYIRYSSVAFVLILVIYSMVSFEESTNVCKFCGASSRTKSLLLFWWSEYKVCLWSKTQIYPNAYSETIGICKSQQHGWVFAGGGFYGIFGDRRGYASGNGVSRYPLPPSKGKSLYNFLGGMSKEDLSFMKKLKACLQYPSKSTSKEFRDVLAAKYMQFLESKDDNSRESTNHVPGF